MTSLEQKRTLTEDSKLQELLAIIGGIALYSDGKWKSYRELEEENKQLRSENEDLRHRIRVLKGPGRYHSEDASY
mgnify:CR=1 FL=1